MLRMNFSKKFTLAWGMILCNMALLLYRLQIAIYLSYPVTKFSHLTFKLALSLSRLDSGYFPPPNFVQFNLI